MLPIFLHFRIRKEGTRAFGFYFPVILIWIILAALLIILLPFVLLAAIFTWRRGPGRLLLLVYPMMASILWHLSGLHIETKSVENEILIDFQ
jgi:predicted exporter